MSTNQAESILRNRLQSFRNDIRKLETEIGRVLVGQKAVVRGTVIALVAGGHVLLEGVPGLGKTLLVRTLAETIRGKFSRIQFTPDLVPADLTGTNLLNPTSDGNRRFEFQRGPVFANVVLADEINRATPKTQAALLEAMQEHSVTVGNTTHPLPDLFFVLATQNPIEMEGTYPLPEAQLDRFFCKILVPFPNTCEMLEILQRTTTPEPAKVENSVSPDTILEMRRLAKQITVADEVARCAVDLVLRTHPNSNASTFVQKYVRYGASPRGAQAMILAAQIQAILDERYHVARDDLFSVAPMVLRHRIILNFEGQAENITTDEIVEKVVHG
ncbi:MAG: MoxR family ATPase [Planctomycetaceae bacterium]|nr:MoxR family ATPase [Planctomycetaceae bacterium]